jgi:hypothetical protein
MWTWTVEWDFALLAACMALCGLVPGLLAHLRPTDRPDGPATAPERGWTAAGLPMPRRGEGLSAPAHAAIARHVTLRIQALGAEAGAGRPGRDVRLPGAAAPDLSLALGPEALERIADGRARLDA